MLGVILSNFGMEVAMWIVLALVGLSTLINLVMGLRGSVQMSQIADTLTRPMIFDIIPLIVLSLLTTLDPTHIVMNIWFYVAAAAIAIRSLLDLIRALQK